MILYFGRVIKGKFSFPLVLYCRHGDRYQRNYVFVVGDNTNNGIRGKTAFYLMIVIVYSIAFPV